MDHSRISVRRKGNNSKNPGCLGVDGIADFDDRAFVRLIMPDYAGMNWTRNIFWRKGEYYLFIDQLEALNPGDYELKNSWKALGVSTAIKDGLAVEQQGQWMHLQTVNHGDFDVETIDVVKDPKSFSRFPNNLKKYTLSEPLVNFCRQTVKCQIAVGERVIFATLITTANTPNPSYLLISNTNYYTVKGSQGDETVAINGRNITFGPKTFTPDPTWREEFKIKHSQ